MKLIQIVSLIALQAVSWLSSDHASRHECRAYPFCFVRGLAPQAKTLSGMCFKMCVFSRNCIGCTRLTRTSKRLDAIEHS